MREFIATTNAAGSFERTRNTLSSPLMFESDEDPEDEEESNDKVNADSSLGNSAEPTKEEKILKGFQTILMGVPPPPAYTVPQLDSAEILKLWNDNHQYRVFPSPSQSRKLGAEQIEAEARNNAWPDVTKLSHWDIYYNCSHISEEMERCSMLYKERCVGVETSSCINVLYSKSPSCTASARKRMRQLAWGHSPGRRLSHLARRRTAFSSANLCSVAGNKNPDKKMIMVEIKKIGNRLLKKSSAKKNSGKKNSVKKNTAKKAKPTPKKKAKSEAANFKRALFQSPDQLPNTEAKTPTNRMARPKRNLFTSSSSEKKVNDNGKRVRTVTKPLTPRKRVNRSLSFRESHTDNPESSAVPSTSYIAEQKCTGALQPSPRLSNLHKQKMLWAVKYALREEGMGSNHPLFHSCLSVLFRTCQRLWLNKGAGEVREGSTSENMLTLAKQFSAFAIKQLSADCTTEHMAKVCIDILRMAGSHSGTKSENDTKYSNNKVTLLNLEDSHQPKNLSPKRVQNPAQVVSTPKSKIKSNKKTRVDSLDLMSPLTRSRKLALAEMSKADAVLNSSNQSSEKRSDVYKLPSVTSSKDRCNKTLVYQSPKETSVNTGVSTPKTKIKSNSNQSTQESSEFTSPLTRSRKLEIAEREAKSGLHSVNQNSDESISKKLPELTVVASDYAVTSKFVKCTEGMQDSFSTTVHKNKSLVQNKTNHFLGIKKAAQTQLAEYCVNSRTDINIDSLEESNRGKLSGDSIEKDKENLVHDRLTNDFSQPAVDSVERSESSQRLLSSVENTSRKTVNRMLQLYSMHNSCSKSATTQRELPTLTEYSTNMEPKTIADANISPPILVSHWDGSDSLSTAPSCLPDSIMTHWQQMSTLSVNSSDKIMFDYEDTSYEIIFPASSNDDTRASSICPPFPHLMDDSKSCFNTIFSTRSGSGNNYDS